MRDVVIWRAAFVLAVLGVVCMGCNALIISGVSVEASGGTTVVAGDSDEMLGRSGRAWNVGFSVNLEAEWVRTSTMGTGIGFTRVSLPAQGAIPAHDISSSVVHAWLSTLIDVPRTDSIRPRVALGALFGGSGEAIRELYLGLGSSFHGGGGWGLHATIGPNFLSAYDEKVGLHYGFGWHGRLRLVKLFFSSCDKAVDIFDGKTHKVDDGCR